jgi:hypothetical protein
MDESRRTAYPAHVHQIRPRGPKPRYSGAEARFMVERELAALSGHQESERPSPPPRRQREPDVRPSPLPGPPPQVIPALAFKENSKEKPIRSGSLMAALSTITPAALLEPEETRPQHIPSAKRLMPSLRLAAISFAMVMVGLTGYAFLTLSGKEAPRSPPKIAASAAGFEGLPADIPLPTRRQSPRPPR